MPTSKKQIYVIILLLASIICTSFFMTITVKGQVNKFLDINRTFNMLERSTIDNEHQNVNHFNISLPSSLWTVNSVELNFSNIQFLPRVETYEDQNLSSYHLFRRNPTNKMIAVAVQVNLSNPATIYGAYIHSRTIPSTISTIKVQIRGYDEVFHQPNSTVYADTDFNVSIQTGWYWQEFVPPITLPKGSYFLVLNGSTIVSTNSDFYWSSNNVDPLNPTLKVLQYDNSWTAGLQGIPLFKLLQKTNIPLYPEDISMKTQINQENYTISNDLDAGKGYLKISGLDYNPNSDSLNFPVFNNVTDSFGFNATSTIKIEKTLSSSANLKVTENQPNRWTLTPTILRTSDNCSVQFDYPRSWENIEVYKNDVEITSQVIVDEIDKTIFIPNETITYVSDWEIKANSPLINFSLNVPKTEFELGKDLLFALGDAPVGNYTFILYDIADVALEPIAKQFPPDDERFSFPIPEDFYEGDYRAVIFWNNLTDGGVVSQIFTFISPSSVALPDFGPLILTLLIVGISVGVAAALYIAYKKFSNAREYALDKILTQCVDISNINLIIVMAKNSGVDLFSTSFSGKKIDPALISGFLHAISTFGAEISEEAQESRTIKLEYKDSILLMNEFVNLRVIVSMKENPSRNFLFIIDDLAFDIYKNYGDEIDNFRGNVKKFQGIDTLIEKHLGVSFVLPLKVVLPKDQQLSLSEQQMVDKALNLLKIHNMETFYSLHLLPENDCSPKDYKTIINLIQKGIFQPQGK